MSTTSNTTRQKIKDLDELAGILSGLKNSGSKVVHCHGVFDLLHIGHIRHFAQAKERGDVLVVSLTEDRYVNKGPGRPAFGQDLRAEAIAALDSVDFVTVNRWPQATEAIKLLRPDFYVKGSDYQDASKDNTGGITLEEEAVRSVNGQLVFTNDITFSSTNLLNRHTEMFPKEVSEYLQNLSSRHPLESITGYLKSARALKVLLIGETIVDEYVYCETMGKAGKEPVLATRHLNTETFAGGIIAVSNHVSAFSDNVNLISYLGAKDSKEAFIRENLNPEIGTQFMLMSDAPTITKRRYVEVYPFQKLFEVYEMDPEGPKAEETSALCAKLDTMLPEFDAVIVTDYGHGMVTPQVLEILSAKAKFLAVNTQVNAGNHGFNTASKYPRADFLCVSETEIRLDARSRRQDLRSIVEETAERLSCDQIVITKGPQGCLCYSRSEGFFEVPAVAIKVVDRIGAGDAVFSVAALCAAQRAPIEITGFLGGVAGAEAVATVGHRSSVQRVPMLRHVESLLK